MADKHTVNGDLLNPAQRNRVGVVLRALEISLRQIEAWLARPEESGLLYRRSLHLSPEAQAVVRAGVAAAMQDIAALAQDLGLHRTEEDLAARIAAEMSISWADLDDSTSGALRRYGPVDTAVADVLDERVNRLAQLALSLANTVRAGDS